MIARGLTRPDVSLWPPSRLTLRLRLRTAIRFRVWPWPVRFGVRSLYEIRCRTCGAFPKEGTPTLVDRVELSGFYCRRCLSTAYDEAFS